MSEQHLKNLARIIRDGWKAIANDEGSDRDTMVEVAKGILDDLEKFESAAESK
jgi:hypothetical protein